MSCSYGNAIEGTSSYVNNYALTRGGFGGCSPHSGSMPNLDDQYAAMTYLEPLTGAMGASPMQEGSCGGTPSLPGKGGGGVIIYSKFLFFSGSIDTRGNDQQSGSMGCGSAAGGGGGGGIFIKCPNILLNSGTTLVGGGSGGGGGNGGSGWLILVNQ